MFQLMILIFVLGYLAIALEHPLKVDKAAPALLISTLLWVIYILGAEKILSLGYSSTWNEFALHLSAGMTKENTHHFIVEKELLHHLGKISEILFFLLGAMTIVEIVDQHHGFKVITDKIHTTQKVKLLWILSFLTFFMSAVLDNLTTTIVMVALLRKLVADKQTRWFFASMIVLAANAGGAWSPIGDVTTIMLWIGGQVTTVQIITRLILPSLVCVTVPLIILSITMKGQVKRPSVEEADHENSSKGVQQLILALGVGGLLFVPVFKTATHLPPYLGMLFSLAILWIVTEIVHRNHDHDIKDKLRPSAIFRKIDTPTVLFFLGILLAVASLQSAGHLSLLAQKLDSGLGNIFLIDIAIGFLSSIVDNVPLVAGAMGMYPIASPEMIQVAADPGYLSAFVQDGLFWEFLAYTAGTGGSMLIIGSAAGVAAMGLEKIDFIWYLKKISWLAMIGYLAGAGVYYLQSLILH
ncbi:MAG TPA: sodium:proton antiporter [Marinilabiliales bacterium]|nr:MAG: sodium:proton antiporter [Bacteroidetes bacterium GWA2_40_14]OFX71802.1 MAG: sodium:proton antiporter [Bacteroidetes bacterium GWD2_40_43]OFX94599.1 MAG: sodium:proton antiporter [Bacteroidetes bacterium GWE2_40_63]OFY22437.1 MAG: sodium:proton antiporter [Bacteroidetes bacterium GWF2_40_13]OFZ24366.1 MAG: sodium:proton antiporter [Bacteroidetes bacterium RIFOXYC2_FULL_40_12]HAM98363.1 sodium:proton antiporter [Marinilabiliales bacterium]